MPYIKVPLTNVIEVEKIISVFDYKLPKDFRYEGESHDFWELIYVKSGEVRVGSGEHIYDLGEAEILFHRPNRFHIVRCMGEVGAEVVIVGFESHSASIEIFGDAPVTVPEECRHYIDECVTEARSSFVPGLMPLTPKADARIGSQQLLRLALEGLMLRLLQARERSESRPLLFTDRRSLEVSLAEDISVYLDSHVYERVRMSEISAHFHFGESHLSHIYKAHFGTSIIGSLIDKKLLRACVLLVETDDTVTAISERLAFDSPQYFSKIFRRRIGASPTEYRRDHT